MYTDGASRGNPGPAAIGVSIEDEAGHEVAHASRRIGVTTNNVAEYQALLEAIHLLEHRGARRAEFLLDSELIVRQMNGVYRVRDPKMRLLHDRARRGLARFVEARFRHVPRTQNTRADALANAALDRATPDA